MQSCHQKPGSIPKASRRLSSTTRLQHRLVCNRPARSTRRLQAASDDSVPGPEGAFAPGKEAEARQGLFNRIAPVYDEVRCGHTSAPMIREVSLALLVSSLFCQRFGAAASCFLLCAPFTTHETAAEQQPELRSALGVEADDCQVERGAARDTSPGRVLRLRGHCFPARQSCGAARRCAFCTCTNSSPATVSYDYDSHPLVARGGKGMLL